MKEVYEKLYERNGEILRETLASVHVTELAKQHALIGDLVVWRDVLANRRESPIFDESIREFQYALMALTQGSYRHAFMSLRLFLELALCSAFLSTDLVSLEEWLQGRGDTRWSAITHQENGLFSLKFAKAFFPELARYVNSQNTLAAKVYRECSEFVHGNRQTPATPANLKYESDMVQAWLTKAETVSEVVMFALCQRYLLELTPMQLASLESVVMGRLQHFSEVRAKFGGRTDQ